MTEKQLYSSDLQCYLGATVWKELVFFSHITAIRCYKALKMIPSSTDTKRRMQKPHINFSSEP